MLVVKQRWHEIFYQNLAVKRVNWEEMLETRKSLLRSWIFPETLDAKWIEECRFEQLIKVTWKAAAFFAV